MKKTVAILSAACLALTLVACGKPAETPVTETTTMQTTVAQPTTSAVDYSSSFKDVDGTAVFYDGSNYNIYNQGKSQEQYSPCSTFKIISTLIGLENGIITSEDSKMGYDGSIYKNTGWNKDVTLKEAFQSSCVWYFRKIIDEAGEASIQSVLNNLSYGNQDISQWAGGDINPTADLNGFWIESSLKISPMEQVQIMSDILNGKTNFKPENIQILKNVMASSGIYGKTGSGRKNGWYVGFIEQDGKNTCFAIHTNSSGAKSKEIALDIISKHYT